MTFQLTIFLMASRKLRLAAKFCLSLWRQIAYIFISVLALLPILGFLLCSRVNGSHPFMSLLPSSSSILNFLHYLFQKIISNLQKSCKNSTEFPNILLSSSPYVSILHNHRTVIKHRKLTLIQYY